MVKPGETDLCSAEANAHSVGLDIDSTGLNVERNRVNALLDGVNLDSV